MKELLPGYYVFSASIFDHELNDHYVTIEGEERRYRDQVVVTDHLKYCKGSRFYELNELIRHQQDGKLQMMMEEYAVKDLLMVKTRISFIYLILEEILNFSGKILMAMKLKMFCQFREQFLSSNLRWFINCRIWNFRMND